jgi:hypothetical protein
MAVMQSATYIQKPVFFHHSGGRRITICIIPRSKPWLSTTAVQPIFGGDHQDCSTHGVCFFTMAILHRCPSDPSPEAAAFLPKVLRMELAKSAVLKSCA